MRNRYVVVSHDIMTLSALTVLTVLCAGVTSAVPGTCINEASAITFYMNTADIEALLEIVNGKWISIAPLLVTLKALRSHSFTCNLQHTCR